MTREEIIAVTVRIARRIAGRRVPTAPFNKEHEKRFVRLVKEEEKKQEPLRA